MFSPGWWDIQSLQINTYLVPSTPEVRTSPDKLLSHVNQPEDEVRSHFCAMARAA